MINLTKPSEITINKECLNKIKDEKAFDLFIKIYEMLIDRNVNELNRILPNIQINQIIGKSISKEKWLEDVNCENIKYYWIDIEKVKTNKNRIEFTSRVRAKLYEYIGCWIIDSYLAFERNGDEILIKEILI